MSTQINKYFLVAVILGLILGMLALGLEVKKLRSELTFLSAVPAKTVSFQHPQMRHKFSGLNDWRDIFDNEGYTFDEFAQIQRRMERMFDDSIQGTGHKGIVTDDLVKLNSDAKEYKDKYIVSMDIPGMEKENINIEIKNGALFVSGERNSEQEEKKANFHRKERNFGYFSQGFALPEDANSSGITVNYNKGVLNIEIPKLAKADASNDKSVKIKVN